ncbi:MAG: hypothetical protein AVDCRST_MAG66-3592, partial [uncultured Pseudonocardia sp.]
CASGPPGWRAGGVAGRWRAAGWRRSTTQRPRRNQLLQAWRA